MTEKNGLKALEHTCLIINAVSMGYEMDYPKPLLLLSIDS